MSDALDRLRSRRRPSVPARDTSLEPRSVDTSISRNLEAQTSENPDRETDQHQDFENSELEGTAKSRHPDIEVPQLDPQTAALETKQSTMRLERGLSDRLQALSRKTGVCREALIEALFDYLEANPAIEEAVLRNATERNEHRQQIANYKRAQSMMKRFSS